MEEFNLQVGGIERLSSAKHFQTITEINLHNQVRLFRKMFQTLNKVLAVATKITLFHINFRKVIAPSDPPNPRQSGSDKSETAVSTPRFTEALPVLQPLGITGGFPSYGLPRGAGHQF